LGLVSFRETQVGIVVKKFRLGGARMPNGRIVALHGEPGIQADTLAPGFHCWHWPWVYRIDKVPAIVVPPGFLGLMNAREGDPIPVNRSLCAAVACDNFQDARKFLSSGGQKGRQSAMLTAGLYRINTALPGVRTDIPTRRIESNKLGVVTALDGVTIPAGQMAAPEVPVRRRALYYRCSASARQPRASSAWRKAVAKLKIKRHFRSSSQATDSKWLKNGERKCVLVLALPALKGSRQSATRIRALGGCRTTVCAQGRTTRPARAWRSARHCRTGYCRTVAYSSSLPL
jgi:hypothetical protein